MSSNNQQYVQPPKQNKVKSATTELRGAYQHLQPSYWKRKIWHLLFVFPIVLMIDEVIVGGLFSTWPLSPVAGIVALALAVVSAYFYPFSLYWYKGSFIGRVLNGMFYFGGFWAVIGKIIATIVGGCLIAGVLAPIAGPLTLKKARKNNWVLGEDKDFD